MTRRGMALFPGSAAPIGRLPVTWFGKSPRSGTAMITLRDPDNIQVQVFGGELDPSITGGRPAA